LQRDQFAKSLIAKDAAIRERNQTLARFAALPEVRNRLCAQRGTTSGCCKPQGECVP
jgi:hypothetical protein